MPDFTLADLLAAQAGAPGPVYEGGPQGNVTPAQVLSALYGVGQKGAQADVTLTQSLKDALTGAVLAPGRAATGAYDVTPEVPGQYSDVDEARRQLNEAHAGRSVFDLASLMIGAPGGAGGVGSGVRSQLGEMPSFTERMDALKDAAFQRAQRGTATGDYGLGTARRTAPEAPKGSLDYEHDRLMSSLRDTQRQLAEYKNPPAKPLLAPGETDVSFFSGGNKKAGAALALDRATTEMTPIGEQYVLPGAERASEATMAQRAADAPLKPEVPQKPPGGMFSDEGNQGSLFSGGNDRAGRLLAGIRAYHGSPYDFEKFDLSKIGAGEGAQAYGHGLYFAENPQTAKTYRDSLSDQKDRLIAGTDLRVPNWVAKGLESGSPNRAQELLTDFRGRVAQNIEEAKTAHDPWNYPGKIEGLQNIVKAIEAHIGGGELTPAGRMYEVNINARPEQFLNYDAPLSQHTPETQQLLNQVYPVGSGGISGSDFYSALERHLHQPGQGHLDKSVASAALNEAGIPGIRYLDQGSRNINPTITALEDWLGRAKAGDKAAYGPIDKLERQLAEAKAAPTTSNYVVFNPEIIDILKKYGLAGLTMGGVLQAQSEPPP